MCGGVCLPPGTGGPLTGGVTSVCSEAATDLPIVSHRPEQLNKGVKFWAITCCI